MMCAALLGHEIGMMAADEVSRVVALVRRIGPLPGWPRVTPTALMAAMRADKKTQAGELRFVLAKKNGMAKSVDGIPVDAVESVLRFAPSVLDGAGKFHE
jgi:3-dehydroquinate synthetase